jgi:hypothetical protein
VKAVQPITLPHQSVPASRPSAVLICSCLLASRCESHPRLIGPEHDHH